jgi:hypothetical protein
MHAEFHSENLKGRNHFGEVNVNGRIILKRFATKDCVRMRIGFNWYAMVPNEKFS